MKVAFVVQRFGESVNGGAETYCLKVAEHMARYWDIEIITTCALDYTSWENAYPEGVERSGALKINRFPVSEPRDTAKFDALSRDVIATPDLSRAEIDEWMKSQGPYSEQLINYVEDNVDKFDCFFFFTYLYATTWFVLPLVGEKSILVPFAHDEWTIHLDVWDEIFAVPSRVVFSTPAEKEFLLQRFGHLEIEGPVVGIAIDRPEEIDPLRFRRSLELDENYLLYVGRVDESKGCVELFSFYEDLCNGNPDAPKLLLLGNPVIDIPESANILSLGFVDEQTKWDALAGCTALVMPSRYESLSMVLLESWMLAKPVMVNGHCEVLVDQCRRSNGGLWYNDSNEFRACVENLLYGGTATVLGKQGYDFVTENYTWQKIENDYLELVEECVVNRT